MSVREERAATSPGPFTYGDLLDTPDDSERYEVPEGQWTVSAAHPHGTNPLREREG